MMKKLFINLIVNFLLSFLIIIFLEFFIFDYNNKKEIYLKNNEEKNWIESEKKVYNEFFNNEELCKCFMEETKNYEEYRSIFSGLIKTESNLKKYALNKTNKDKSLSVGYTQLNYNYYKKDYSLHELYDTEINIKLGFEVFLKCYDLSKRKEIVALAYYNSGYGKVNNYRSGIITFEYISKILRISKEIDEKLSVEYEKLKKDCELKFNMFLYLKSLI
jgi:hypothetical protein